MKLTKIVILSALFALASCSSSPILGVEEQHGEVENFPCGGMIFPCLGDGDAETFNARLPFCFANPAVDHGLASNAINGCQVGEEDSAVGCQFICGDLGPVFTSTCAYQYNATTDEYVGRCYSSYVP
jgi:hypothetical protein